jgi:hypothetical protein
MLESPVANAHWHHLAEDFAEYQLALVDADDTILAGHNSAPLPWDGTDASLPAGWDAQMDATLSTGWSERDR